MLFRPLRAELFLTDCRTRLPFRFGISTLRAAPLATLRLEVEGESGERVLGHAGDLLVPRWFRKDPNQSLEDDVRELIEAATLAAAAFTREQATGATVFEAWQRVYRERVESVPLDAPDRLVRGFGVALVERALMDAACRLAGCSFFAALKSDLFGVRPGDVLPELADWDLPASLPDAPADEIVLRHTVGLVDPLRTADVPASERVEDGLPQSLEEDIASYGLQVFKVKVGGTGSADQQRLLQIARVLDERVAGQLRLTLDGNEQVTDLSALTRMLDGLEGEAAGRRLLEGLLYIEQPLPRADTLERACNAGLEALSERAAVIIDEADFGLESFPRALELGYRGVSIKNCKGVFRALLNRGVAERSGGFQSGEDLTNLPALALQQDLATMAALGVEHVERNGHHYFRGLDHLPTEEVEQALAQHPDLYEVNAAGGARLRVQGGRLSLRSLDCVGYGHGLDVRTEARTAAADWRGMET